MKKRGARNYGKDYWIRSAGTTSASSLRGCTNKKSERILRHKEPDVNRLKYFEEEKLNGRHGRPKPRRLGMQIQIGMDSEI